MRWSELTRMQYVGQTDLPGQSVELFRAPDGTLYQVRRDRGVFREIRPGEQLGDFQRWDLLMPDPIGARA
ncbi:MAG TPA: hypothetical protein VFN91_19340 [Myxococcaceae bacterium]|nr:hypothetical protein [Myxococcaceae bacterium]